MGKIKNLINKIKTKITGKSTTPTVVDKSIKVDATTTWNQRQTQQTNLNSTATDGSVKLLSKTTNLYWYNVDSKTKKLTDKMTATITKKDYLTNIQTASENIVYWLHDETIRYKTGIRTWKKVDKIIDKAHSYFKRNVIAGKNSIKKYLLDNYTDIFNVNKINQLDMRDDFFYADGAIAGENGIGYGYLDGQHKIYYLPVYFTDIFKFYSPKQLHNLNANFVTEDTITQWVISYLTTTTATDLDLSNGIFIFVPDFDSKFNFNEELYQRRFNQYVQDCYNNKWYICIEQLQGLGL